MAGISGDFDAGLVAKFRRHAVPKISWNVLYMKAYASVCRQNPILRRNYVAFPFRHLYEHDANVCMLTIARVYKGEERLFFARFNAPDLESLEDLQKQFDHYRKAPVEDIKQFRHQMMFAKAPVLVRRAAWWGLFNVWPSKRASHIGTFGMSISGYRGVYGTKHLGPNTTILGIDPFPTKGVSRITLTFDHRVLDGAPAKKALHDLQHILTTAIKVELALLTGFHPKTGEKLNDTELKEFKRDLQARREAAISKRMVA